VERHRLLALLIESRPELVSGRVLHFAPEQALTAQLRARASEYLTTDLSEHSDVTADIVDLPFPAQRWDTILCSHVLEHVPDDRTAMRELRRVLAADGRAIILVPRVVGVPTDEDPDIQDPRERERRFGQPDHVRMYGDDLEDRLRSAGFTHIQAVQPSAFSPDQVRRHRLAPTAAGAGDVVLICE
jgi:SAM-dependent methyltransferase